MSTRANVVIDYQGEAGTKVSRVYLYRHSDGYPSVCGARIAHFARIWAGYAGLAWMSAPMLAQGMVRWTEGERYDGTPHFPFQMTDDVHGDIEWLYVVRIRAWHSHDWKVRVCKVHIPIGDSAPELDRLSDGDFMELPGFRRYVAREAVSLRDYARKYRERMKANAV